MVIGFQQKELRVKVVYGYKMVENQYSKVISRKKAMVKYLGINKDVKHIRIYHMLTLRKERRVNQQGG